MSKLLLPACLFLLCSCSLRAPAQATVLNYSTSTLPDEPAETGAAAGAAWQEVQAGDRPFRALAVEFRVGVAGIGFEFGTPLGTVGGRRFHLRAGAQFFEHALNPNADGLHTVGTLTLQNVQTSVDFFPFRRSSFHISPGVTLHNDNHLFSNIFVRAGDTFSLGSDDYVSDPANPITGYSRVKFGNTIAPRLTAGFGNMLPTRGSRFSVPVEIGFQYISSPTLELHLSGNACDRKGCGDINASDGPANIASEVRMLNQDIAGLRFYPVLSIGLAYKFGR